MKLVDIIASQMHEIQRVERLLNHLHEQLQRLREQQLSCDHRMHPAVDPTDVSGDVCSECGISDLELTIAKQVAAAKARERTSLDAFMATSRAFREVLPVNIVHMDETVLSLPKLKQL